MLTGQTVQDVLGAKNKVKLGLFRNMHKANTERYLTTPIQEPLILILANNWTQFENDMSRIYPTESMSITSFTNVLNENCSLLFSGEVLDFCSKENVFHECCKYHSLFLETFRNIQKIDVFVSEDPEIPDYRHVSFLLTISDSIENILQYENNFNKKLRNFVDKEKRLHFVYNYNLI
ncbi:MAG: hypothetical protein HZC49_14330 [Nitrospirae bacterium]|nr:hypothetical protein [Nitrospirota bacterium]